MLLYSKFTDPQITDLVGNHSGGHGYPSKISSNIKDYSYHNWCKIVKALRQEDSGWYGAVGHTRGN